MATRKTNTSAPAAATDDLGLTASEGIGIMEDAARAIGALIRLRKKAHEDGAADKHDEDIKARLNVCVDVLKDTLDAEESDPVRMLLNGRRIASADDFIKAKRRQMRD